MPTDERILGFSNRWYPQALSTATRVNLPSGRMIRLISAPAFLATKLEAFATRGMSDFLSSHDFEDIINVIDGRPGVVDEIAGAEAGIREYLTRRFEEIVQRPDFVNTLPGLLAYDEIYDERIQRVRSRIHAIAGVR